MVKAMFSVKPLSTMDKLAPQSQAGATKGSVELVVALGYLLGASLPIVPDVSMLHMCSICIR